MDNAVLTAVVGEMAERLAGADLGDIVQIDSRRFALRFSVSPFWRLAIHLHPELSSLHLAARVPTPKVTTELATSLGEPLVGTRLVAIRKERDERVVEMEFRGGDDGRGGFIVLELLGKASNLLLLDSARRIVRYVRSHHGEFRQPKEGEPYTPPPPRPGGRATHPFASLLLAREIEARAAGGESAEAARSAVEKRFLSGGWEPCLYSRTPVDTVEEAEALAAEEFFIAPFPLTMGERLLLTRFETMNEAAEAHAALVSRRLLFRDLESALLSLVKGESDRNASLIRTLERESAETSKAPELRRRGELLLGSLGTAKKQGGEVEVVDYYDPALPRIRIAVDPKLDLKSNAEALFHRARRLERGAAIIAKRLTEKTDRLKRLEAFAERVREARSTEALESIEAGLNRSGLVKVFRKPERREAGKKPSFVKVREFRTSDGWTLLVGKSSAENDLLTFKIAAPNDFWFHAAGRAGAHVVLRNPKRAKEPPETALMEAAGVAAWYSKGKRHEGEEVEIHWTQRKEVRKGRGMSPGMVMLRHHRTILARAALPPGVKAEVEE